MGCGAGMPLPLAEFHSRYADVIISSSDVVILAKQCLHKVETIKYDNAFTRLPTKVKENVVLVDNSRAAVYKGDSVIIPTAEIMHEIRHYNTIRNGVELHVMLHALDAPPERYVIGLPDVKQAEYTVRYDDPSTLAEMMPDLYKPPQLSEHEASTPRSSRSGRSQRSHSTVLTVSQGEQQEPLVVECAATKEVPKLHNFDELFNETMEVRDVDESSLHSSRSRRSVSSVRTSQTDPGPRQRRLSFSEVNGKPPPLQVQGSQLRQCCSDERKHKQPSSQLHRPNSDSVAEVLAHTIDPLDECIEQLMEQELPTQKRAPRRQNRSLPVQATRVPLTPERGLRLFDAPDSPLTPQRKRRVSFG